jgi:hypothetical protein
MNRQTELFNLGFETYSSSYINRIQYNWSNWLLLVDFIANTSISKSTRVSPFFANAKQDPNIFLDLN